MISLRFARKFTLELGHHRGEAHFSGAAQTLPQIDAITTTQVTCCMLQCSIATCYDAITTTQVTCWMLKCSITTCYNTITTQVTCYRYQGHTSTIWYGPWAILLRILISSRIGGGTIQIQHLRMNESDEYEIERCVIFDCNVRHQWKRSKQREQRQLVTRSGSRTNLSHLVQKDYLLVNL